MLQAGHRSDLMAYHWLMETQVTGSLNTRKAADGKVCIDVLPNLNLWLLA